MFDNVGETIRQEVINSRVITTRIANEFIAFGKIISREVYKVLNLVDFIVVSSYKVE
jgi:hypothetical protein